MNNRDYYIHLLILCIIQIIILNNVHIGSYFYINIYMLALYILPRKVKGIPLLLAGFLLGGIIDLSSNTWGIHAAATTFIAYLRPYLSREINEEMEDHAQNNHKSLELRCFFRYTLLSTFLFYVVLVLLEAFSFRNIGISLLRIVASTFISEIFIMLYYFIGLKKNVK